MKQKFLITISIFIVLASEMRAQIEPYESLWTLPTVKPIDNYNKVEYDKCTGTLNFGVESTVSGTNGTYAIVKMFVYVKIGGIWKLMVTIRGVDGRDLNSGPLYTGTSGGWSSITDVTSTNWTPPAFNLVTGGTISGDNPTNDLRIAYASGSNGNYYWASYQDHNICQTYDANANLTNAAAPMDLVPYANPPRMFNPHGSQIPQNLSKISYYPGSGTEWGLQFGITNIPAEAINGNVVNIRVYKHSRSVCGTCITSTAAPFNVYESFEFATNVNSIDAPFGLSATTNQCSQITLNWQNPTQKYLLYQHTSCSILIMSEQL